MAHSYTSSRMGASRCRDSLRVSRLGAFCRKAVIRQEGFLRKIAGATHVLWSLKLKGRIAKRKQDIWRRVRASWPSGMLRERGRVACSSYTVRNPNREVHRMQTSLFTRGISTRRKDFPCSARLHTYHHHQLFQLSISRLEIAGWTVPAICSIFFQEDQLRPRVWTVISINLSSNNLSRHLLLSHIENPHRLLRLRLLKHYSRILIPSHLNPFLPRKVARTLSPHDQPRSMFLRPLGLLCLPWLLLLLHLRPPETQLPRGRVRSYHCSEPYRLQPQIRTSSRHFHHLPLGKSRPTPKSQRLRRQIPGQPRMRPRENSFWSNSWLGKWLALHCMSSRWQRDFFLHPCLFNTAMLCFFFFCFIAWCSYWLCGRTHLFALI